MCQYPWSDHDYFTISNTCSVYLPIDTFLNVLMLGLSAIGFFLGLYQTKQTKRILPFIHAIFTLCFFITYAIIVSTNLRYVDRNYGLNILHALSLMGFAVGAYLEGFRDVDIVTSVDAHTIKKSRKIHRFLRKVDRVIVIINGTLQFSKVLFPTIFSSLDFITFVGTASIITVITGTIPRVWYAYKVREIILEMEQLNPQFYQPLKTKINRALRIRIYSWIWSNLLNLCWITIPTLRHNSYIVYNIIMIILALLSIYVISKLPKKMDKSKNSKFSRDTTTSGEEERSMLGKNNNNIRPSVQVIIQPKDEELNNDNHDTNKHNNNNNNISNLKNQSDEIQQQQQQQPKSSLIELPTLVPVQDNNHALQSPELSSSSQQQQQPQEELESPQVIPSPSTKRSDSSGNENSEVGMNFSTVEENEKVDWVVR